MHENEQKQDRGEQLRSIYQTCGVLFEQIERAELDIVVENYLASKVADLLSAVEVFARLIDREVHDG